LKNGRGGTAEKPRQKKKKKRETELADRGVSKSGERKRVVTPIRWCQKNDGPDFAREGKKGKKKGGRAGNTVHDMPERRGANRMESMRRTKRAIASPGKKRDKRGSDFSRVP